MRLLVAESDGALGTFIQRGLENENYFVDAVGSGSEAQAMTERANYDLLIFDVNAWPERPFEFLNTVRAHNARLRILLLSTQAKPEDRVRALNEGADDCLLKPFSFSELSARVRALLRRTDNSAATVLRLEDLELDRISRTVRRGEKAIALTQKEFVLLEYLLRNAGRPVTRSKIIENVWQISFDTRTNVVDVYINYIRKKVDSGFERRLIHTVRGVGYQAGYSAAGPTRSVASGKP